MVIKVYGASKLNEAQTWKDLARWWADEVQFVNRWAWSHVNIFTDEPSDARIFWPHDLADVARADFVMVLPPSGDQHLRGALVEVGAGIALGKQIALVGDSSDYGTWRYHPSVFQFPTVGNAYQFFERLNKSCAAEAASPCQ